MRDRLFLHFDQFFLWTRRYPKDQWKMKFFFRILFALFLLMNTTLIVHKYDFVVLASIVGIAFVFSYQLREYVTPIVMAVAMINLLTIPIYSFIVPSDYLVEISSTAWTILWINYLAHILVMSFNLILEVVYDPGRMRR